MISGVKVQCLMGGVETFCSRLLRHVSNQPPFLRNKDLAILTTCLLSDVLQLFGFS